MKKLRFHPCGNYRENYKEELTIFETDFGRLWLGIGLLVLFLILPWVVKPYMIYVLNMMGIAAIAAIGLNILIGFTGQISLGHGAFFGVGAYAAAVLATSMDLPFFMIVPAAAVVTSLVGMIFGIPSVRLKGLYLTIATLAGQFIVEYILLHWESVTKGTMGITLPKATLLGWDLSGDKSFFFVIFICLIVMTWIAVNMIRTKYGRAFIAIRDNDLAAEVMGVNLLYYKLLAFFIGCFFAGIAGSLLAHYTGSVYAEQFSFTESILYVAM
ncbi:MAG: branched-chain amino acid ABC transporter permease, partial [Deltaproteobacteria bacterium]|nr:branched-chain amino acid ABC transporter permease [Deltaproteobacteria bacterium]